MKTIIKFIKMFIAFWAVSMFYFPFEFTFFRGSNVKMMMAVLGLVLCLVTLIKKRSIDVPKNLIPLFSWAALVSLAGVLAMTLNGTIDDAYAGYIVSMAVWLSAAFVACAAIKWAHGKITLEILGHYLIVVCLAQCAEAIIIDNVPAVQNLVDAYISVGQATLHRINRLYGIGASLDVAGARFSPVLLLIMHLIYNQKSDSPKMLFWFYVLSFVLLTVFGSMIARTTYVGVAISAAYVLFNQSTWKTTLSMNTVGKGLTAVMMMALLVVIGVFLYNNNVSFRHWIRFAFEGFFNYYERGRYYIASADTLLDMYVFPDNMKTWIIGDGYFSNPYWSDATYTYINQNKTGYYMFTDVGYLRFIFYFGVIGLAMFCMFMINAARACMKLMKEHSKLFFWILVINFVIWFKVATDIFCAFALLICLGNMQEDIEAEGDSIDDRRD